MFVDKRAVKKGGGSVDSWSLIPFPSQPCTCRVLHYAHATAVSTPFPTAANYMDTALFRAIDGENNFAKRVVDVDVVIDILTRAPSLFLHAWTSTRMALVMTTHFRPRVRFRKITTCTFFSRKVRPQYQYQLLRRKLRVQRRATRSCSARDGNNLHQKFNRRYSRK